MVRGRNSTLFVALVVCDALAVPQCAKPHVLGNFHVKAPAASRQRLRLSPS